MPAHLVNRLAAGSAVGGVLFDTFGTTGSLLTATVAAGLGSAAVSGRSAAVDRFDLAPDPAEGSSPNCRPADANDAHAAARSE